MMNKLTIFILSTIISSSALADFEIPNQFEDGQVTSASQMNENFQALKVEIEALKAQLEQSQTEPKVEFKGYSAPISGSSGIAELAAACDAVSTGSRICLGDELLKAPYNENFVYPQDNAYIARKLSHANVATGGSTRTQEWLGETRSCWSGGSLQVLWSNGRMASNASNGSNSCTNEYPVACCK